MIRLTFRPLDSKMKLSDFDCGSSVLNTYLKKYAKRNDKSGVSKVMVACQEDVPEKVIGFYTISAGQMEFSSLPPVYKAKLPRYPIPIVRIGRLAIDLSMQRKGCGEELLMHAFKKIIQVAEKVGIVAVVVDAKDEKLKKFYEKFGFVAFQDRPLSLFIPMQKITHSF